MFRLLVTTLLALWACTADALDLYSGEVPVSDTSEQTREQALPSAFVHVLQKLSGLRDLEPTAELDRMLAESPRLVLAFYYDESSRLMPDGSSQQETYLVVNFLPEGADQALRDLELPRWRTERPPITLWIAIDDGRGRRLLPVEYDYVRDALDHVARQRGLSIAWPELDPESSDELDLGLLWGGFAEQLPSPAEASGGTVIVTARRAGAAWRLRWTYDAGIETMGWGSEEFELTFALTDGLHRLTDIMAEADSIHSVAGESWPYRIRVRGLDGEETYARALAYLESLSLVDDLAVESAMRGQVEFLLVLNAEPRYLDEIIVRDRILAPGVERGTYLLTE
jgi:hypothetical protein